MTWMLGELLLQKGLKWLLHRGSDTYTRLRYIKSKCTDAVSEHFYALVTGNNGCCSAMQYMHVKLHFMFTGWGSLMVVETRSNDFWPFPSKEFALLYYAQYC